MQLVNGMDDRSQAFVFTCDRWAGKGVYIILPINPSSIEIANPLHATVGETQRGKFVYVHRNPKTGTAIAPCNYTFEIPSGFILPQFNDDYITQAQSLALEYAKNVHALRVRDLTWARSSTGDVAADNQAQIQVQLSKYAARAAEYTAPFPSPMQVKDYRTGNGSTAGSIYKEQTLEYDELGNMPDLYQPNVPIGIQNFYAFLMLMDEPRVYTDANGNLRNNRAIVHFNTVEFPSMTFYGWWDESGISYTEDVEDYGQFNISFSLFVTAEDPAYGYGKFSSLMTKYKAETGSYTTSLDRLKAIVASTKPEPIQKLGR